MSAERRQPVLRRAELGPGAVGRLADVLRAWPAGAVVLVSSRHLDGAQRAVLEQAAGRAFAAQLHTPAELDAPALARLAEQLAQVRPAAVVACGGGTVMDAAKVLTRPGRTGLVLVPKTLSGAEHTANTSWWEEGRKRVATVGMADAVLADPALLLADWEVLGPGALHAVAHALATARQPAAGGCTVAIARAALADLVPALATDDLSGPGRLRLLRGAWLAAVGFALTGPRIGAHHLLVHRYARPGQHARFSARLVCGGLLHTDVHAPAVAVLAGRLPWLPERLAGVAGRWLPRVADAAPRTDAGAGPSPAAADDDDARTLLAVVARG
ncbi:MAG: iron-containing alcohol dehydrogenase [Micromonosporaceae bacterium]|nr:iron-containing alcohol dehydrogenase [Micromonosporaceae bacterium]